MIILITKTPRDRVCYECNVLCVLLANIVNNMQVHDEVQQFILSSSQVTMKNFGFKTLTGFIVIHLTAIMSLQNYVQLNVRLYIAGVT